MTDEMTNVRKRQRHVDRITLDVEAQDRVDAWIRQVVESRKGVALARKDIVNWLVNGRAIALTGDEVAALAARYFNKKRFLRQALKELNQAMSAGVDVPLEDLLAAPATAAPAVMRKRRSRRKVTGDVVAADEVSPPEQTEHVAAGT